MNGTYEEIDGRPAIRFERRLRHPAERVWRALTDPAEMAGWFPARVRRDGDALSFEFEGHEMPPMRGRCSRPRSRGCSRSPGAPRSCGSSWSPRVTPRGCASRTSSRSATPRRATPPAGRCACRGSSWRSVGREAGAPGTGVTLEWSDLYEKYVESGMPSGAEIPGRR